MKQQHRIQDQSVMRALTWQRIRTGIIPTSGGRNQGLRKVATRLAAQTVGLLLVMLVALEIVVYLITQHALLGSLESTLQSRARQADPSVCRALHLPCEQAFGAGPGQGQAPGPGGNPGSGGNGGSGANRGSGSPFGRGGFTFASGPSEASVAYVDARLHIIHADGALGRVVLGSPDIRQVLRTNRAHCCTEDEYKGEDYLVYTAPLRSAGKAVGAVQASISEHQYEHTMGSLLQALFVVTLLGLLTSGGVSVVLVSRALQPIRLALQRQRDFVADAAHELRTPLAIQRTVGEIGISDASVDDLQATVVQMLGENRHLARLVEDLSLLARTDTDAIAIDRRPVDFSLLLTETSDEIQYLAGEQGVTLDVRVAEHVTLSGDILRLRQLLLILLDNALKHTPSGGSVRLLLAPHGGSTRLEVADSGPGIDPADLPRIFDRFYRGDQARTGEGSGLGLAIAKWIVEAHGGHIQARNASPHGAVFEVTLPLARISAPA